MNLELRIAIERLVHLQKVRTAVLASFGPGRNPKARLHNGEVTKQVAAALDREPSPALGRDVIQAMRAYGWRAVSHSRITWWKGIVKR